MRTQRPGLLTTEATIVGLSKWIDLMSYDVLGLDKSLTCSS